MASTLITVVGDFNAANRSHLATNEAIAHSSAALESKVEARWIDTAELAAPGGLGRLAGASGLWIAPASPYNSMEGALAAIRMARERGIPLLGTCGGFQHIILEYARNVLGIADAQHEESEPDHSRLVISRLSCSLVGRTMMIRLQPESLVGRAYGRSTAQEAYHCNFGVNPAYVETLWSSGLRIVGSDDEGAVRAVELEAHPFFVGTLFLPQLDSTPARPHPLVTGFVRACLCEGSFPKATADAN
ncbi:MAG: glutamine amidotransferase-related protein [Limisphaerales bacterium]